MRCKRDNYDDGFTENTDVAMMFRGFKGEDDEVFEPVEVKEYYINLGRNV